MAALQTLPSKVQLCVQSGLLILRDELIRDSSDQWKVISFWPVQLGHVEFCSLHSCFEDTSLSPHLCKRMHQSGIPWWCSDHLEQDLRVKNFANEFRACWDQGTQKDQVRPIGFRPQCQCQWVTMKSLSGQSDQSQASEVEILERFNHVPPKTCWNILTHAQTSKFWGKLPIEHRYFQRAEVEQGQCDQGSKVLPQAPKYENQMTIHLSHLSPLSRLSKLWLRDCFCTWFLSTISVSGLAWLMPVVQRWQAAGTSQAQVVATNG